MAQIDKIHHPYALNNPVTIYDEESLTALELVARLAGKLNETINAYNTLDEETREHLSEQDKTIMDGLATLTKQLPPYVSEWLEAHPEITTTLQDGEVMLSKLHESATYAVVNNYVTPEMYGYTGAGDASAAIQAALDANQRGKPVLLNKHYTVVDLNVHDGATLIVDGTLSVNGTIKINGSHNKITGSGVIQGNGKNDIIAVLTDTGTNTFFNIIDVKEIRDGSTGILFYTYEDNGCASYFNIVRGVTFVNFTTCGVHLHGWANGNKLSDLCFYNCGTANNRWLGAIMISGTEEKHPIENMFTNISTTNATNCVSIALCTICEYNHFSGLQFENGGDQAWGFHTHNDAEFRNNTIAGMIDINNQGSKRGVNNTWVMAYNGKNEMPAIKTREQYRPCGFKYALKKDSDSAAFSDGTQYTVAKISMPAYSVANINLRAMLVSSAAGDIATGSTGNLIIRAKSDGSIVPVEDGDFAIQSDGWINYRTPDAGVGVAHYTTCFMELDIITTRRDTSQSMTPGHYGVTITPFDTFKEYKGDW